MNGTTERACAWAGVASMLLFLAGMLIAGFLPPPSPRNSAAEVARMFTEDATRIRAGVIVIIFGAALLGAWTAAMTVQMRRMEGKGSVLAYLNLAMGALFVIEFLIPLVIWQSMTYRADRSPEILLAMSDTAWLLFVCITSTPALQAIAIGVAVLRDRRPDPVFPRWTGYLSLWTAFLFMSGTISVFFKDGPFAWNGVLTWWVPFVVFGFWLAVNTACLLRAIRAQEAVENVAANSLGEDVDVRLLAEEVRTVKAQLAALMARQAS